MGATLSSANKHLYDLGPGISIRKGALATNRVSGVTTSLWHGLSSEADLLLVADGFGAGVGTPWSGDSNLVHLETTVKGIGCGQAIATGRYGNPYFEPMEERMRITGQASTVLWWNDASGNLNKEWDPVLRVNRPVARNRRVVRWTFTYKRDRDSLGDFASIQNIADTVNGNSIDLLNGTFTFSAGYLYFHAPALHNFGYGSYQYYRYWLTFTYCPLQWKRTRLVAPTTAGADPTVSLENMHATASWPDLDNYP